LLEGLKQYGDGVTFQGANGRIQLNLQDESQLPAMARWIVNQGHSLYELSPRRLSLEEHFLRIIGEP
jgi:hypothetical protein